MNHDFAAAMRRATFLTRARDVTNATRVIHDALSRRTASERASPKRTVPDFPARQELPILRLVQPDHGIAETSPQSKSSTEPVTEDAEVNPDMRGFPALHRMRRPLAEALRLLREGQLKIGALRPLPGVTPSGMMKARQPLIPDGAYFVTRSFSCAAGTRSYKLYVPASAPDRPRGLVVMLHGCKQDPDDFAVGTNMNAVAEAHGLMVAYPAQTGSANAMSCWNWFNPADQTRDAGEPSIIAGITREIASQYQLDRHVVFVAGLSAGGAMAAVMGETYPDLYAAVGIHSGLAYKSAHDVVTAFAAMRGEAGLSPRAKPRIVMGPEARIRMIVFQGSADQTVSPTNARNIVEAASRRQPGAVPEVEQGSSAGGRIYARTVITRQDGEPVVEYWLIDGAGHAWSGGRPEGSYTDPEGPDASAEMIRFFLRLS